VLALTYTGGVYSWGDVGRAYMAFGHEPGSGVIGTAWKLRQLPKRIEALRGVRVRCIAAGGMHSCAVTDEGHVYTWGSGHDGALGHTGFGGVWLPKRVEALHANGVFAVGVAAGAEHTLGAGADGAVWGFGSLNAIGAWNDPTLKAMLASHAENDAFYKLFASTFSDNLVRVACFDFLFLRRVSNISKPLRVTVNEFQDLKVLRH
jgi:alpha-tubulin suppressor-like RCC1 family protein